MFSRKSVSVSNNTGKRMNGILQHFQQKWGMGQGKKVEQYEDVAVSPLNPGCHFRFSGSVFVSNILEKKVNGFSWNFHEIPGTIQNIVRLFHAWLDCFTVLHLGAGECLLATLRFNGYIDFLAIFRMGLLGHKQQPGTFWGSCAKPLRYRVHFTIFRFRIC